MGMMGKFFGKKGEGGRKDKSGRKSVRRQARKTRSVSPTRPGNAAPGATSNVKKPSTRSATATKKPRTPDTDLVAKSPSSPGSLGGLPGRGSVRRKRTSMRGKQLGMLLLKDGKITEEQLDQALGIQAQKGGILGQILVAQEACLQVDVVGALRKQRTITTVDLTQVEFSPEVFELLPREFCVKNRLIPFEKIGNHLCVAMSNVLDAQAKTDIKEKTQLQVKAFDASWADIKQAIEKYLAAEEEAGDAATAASAATEAGDEIDVDNIVIELPEDEIVVVEDAPAQAREPSPGETVISAPSAALPAAGSNVVEDLELAEIEEIVIEAAPGELPDIPAIEDASRKTAAAAASSAPAVVIEDLDFTEIEEISDLEPAAAAVVKLPAIPMSTQYFAEVVQAGKVDPERRWLAEHLAESALPVEPAPDLMKAS